MITTDDARQQATDLVKSGDPHRAIVVMLTPFKLAVLHLHLATHIDAVKGLPRAEELLKGLNEIQHDVQRTVTQILQSQYPQT